MATKPEKTQPWGRRLVQSITCPTCWYRFPVEEVHFVARHPELIGDPVLGSNEYVRFLPSRFNHKGEALDEHGAPTSQLACPRCHLHISEALLEVPPLFISIVGSPASGKSYFLTTMTWALRHLLPRGGLSFTDADPEANSAIMEYEQSLFMASDPDQFVAIRKTQTDDPRLHKTARIDGVDVRFPLPLEFTVWPMAEHPFFDRPHRVGRVCVFYDNAGEDCLPGNEAASSSVVQHLAESGLLFALFDPAQEPRVREMCGDHDPQTSLGLRPGTGQGPTFMRQELILKEAAVRIRRYLGISQSQRIHKPLIVIVAKFDMVSEAFDIFIEEEPYTSKGTGGALRLDLGRVENTSRKLRMILNDVCPEFVATAEGLSDIVRYIPSSSLGTAPELAGSGETQFFGIRPRDIKPKWVTVPMIYCMSKWASEVLRKSRT